MESDGVENMKKFKYFMEKSRELKDYFHKNGILTNGEFLEVMDHFIAANVKLGVLKMSDVKHRNESILHIVSIINSIEKFHENINKKTL